MKKEKKKRKIILFSLFIILISILGYKLFTLKYYEFHPTQDDLKIFNQFKNLKTLEIKTEKNLTFDYITHKNISFINVFQDFNLIKDKDPYTQYQLDKNNIQATFIIDSFDSFHKLFSYSNDEITFYNGTNTITTNTPQKFTTQNYRQEFLKKNNINDDVDLIKFIKENGILKSNLFSSTKTMKQNYSYNMFLSIVLPTAEEVTIITGDLNGYILKIGNFKQVNILKDDLQYNLQFFNLEYFNDDLIKTILESVTFN